MKIVFSDFDGTLTHQGKLVPEFFKILDLIQKHKSELVIVSGRSVSWGHFLLTHFPIKAVIMEGGGIIISRAQDGTLKEEVLVDVHEIKRLEQLTHTLKKEVPECVFSLDTFGRHTDRAVEFLQMSNEAISKTEKYLHDHKANFSQSNVHINFWMGDISKARASKYFLTHYRPHVKISDTIFYGDAKNDESMFEEFPHTVGVSNIFHILDELKFKPSVVLEGKDNSGPYGVLNHLEELFDQIVDF